MNYRSALKEFSSVAEKTNLRKPATKTKITNESLKEDAAPSSQNLARFYFGT